MMVDDQALVRALRFAPARATLAIAHSNLLMTSRDALPLISLVLMPLLVMGILRSLFEQSTFVGATGSSGSYAVPGTAVMFSFFIVNFTGISLYREHGYHTWERLRASPAGGVAIILGKAVPPLVVSWLQLTLLFLVGGPLYGLEVTGSWMAIAMVIATYSLSLTCFGIAVALVCRTLTQVSAVGNLGTLVFGWLGGAIVPAAALPDWTQPMCRFVPSYWAMEGLHRAVLFGGGPGDVLGPVAYLLAFAVVFAVGAGLCFRSGTMKVVWS